MFEMGVEIPMLDLEVVRESGLEFCSLYRSPLYSGDIGLGEMQDCFLLIDR